MPFTEFVCRSGGNNMNGGADHTNAEVSTSALYSATNGGWNSGTGVFTPTSGNPSLTVTVGDFAHVFADGTTTPAAASDMVARVTAVNSTTITLSTTAKSGTAPTTAGSGISINVGGAWLGPNAGDGFPLNYVAAAMINSSGDNLRVNLKNDATYSISTGITTSTANLNACFRGYTTSFGDGGKFLLDGGTNAIVPWTISGSGIMVCDGTITNNASSGTNSGFIISGGSIDVFNFVVHDVRGDGFDFTGATPCNFISCEAYNCVLAGGATNRAGFQCNGNGGGAGVFLNCISHDNTASTAARGYRNCASVFIGCIADSNAHRGFEGASYMRMINCDAYHNGLDGFYGNVAFQMYINCNSVANGAWGFNVGTASTTKLITRNNRYGAGSQANTSGDVNIATDGGVYDIVDFQALASNSTPWVDPANGDFRITLSDNKDTGYGAYTQTSASYSGTVGYPDIGAAQHQDSAGGSGGGIRIAGHGGLAA